MVWHAESGLTSMRHGSAVFFLWTYLNCVVTEDLCCDIVYFPLNLKNESAFETWVTDDIASQFSSLAVIASKLKLFCTGIRKKQQLKIKEI